MLLLVSSRRHLPNNPRQIISLLPSVEPTLTYIEASVKNGVCACVLAHLIPAPVSGTVQWGGGDH